MLKAKNLDKFGIINLSRDSFSESYYSDLTEKEWWESRFNLFESFTKRDFAFVDIGAESTRPLAEPISEKKEAEALIKFLYELKIRFFDKSQSKLLPKLSIDSYKSQVIKHLMAENEISSLISCINDVKALSQKAMAEELLKSPKGKNLKIIIMHSKGSIPPKLSSKDIPDDFYESEGGLEKAIMNFFNETINKGLSKGLLKSQFILDPGLGFGKNLKHSMEILELIPKLKAHFKVPVLIGSSRKSFLSLWKPDLDRDLATIEYNNLAKNKGADYFRIHAEI